MPPWFWIIISTILGAVFGSGLTAWLWRSEHTGLRGKKRSTCPACEHTIAWYDLVPILSYLLLRGRCRFCHHSIPSWYPCLELSGAILAAATTSALLSAHTPPALFAAYLILVATLFAIAWYDALYQLIPIIPTALVSALGLFVIPLTTERTLLAALIAASSASAFFAAQYVISRGRWIGSGDAYLGFLVGAWLGAWPTVVALYIAYCVGALIGVALIITKKRDRFSHLPLGTFLALGAYCSLLWGERIIAFFNYR